MGTQYMVRVEIHNNAYDALHVAMEAEGFARFFTGAHDGKRYHAPTGIYWMEPAHTSDANAVLDAAKRAALGIDRSSNIAVCGSGQIAFFNCREETPQLAKPLYGAERHLVV